MRMLVGIARGIVLAARLVVGSIAAAAMLVGPSWPVAAQAVTQIVIQGNRRIEAATIRTYLSIKPGERISATAKDEALKTLLATGLFSDVRIASQAGRLIVTVQEKPVINQVAFEGNRTIKAEVLRQAVESKSQGVLSRAEVQSDVQRILELYGRQGRVHARVEPKVIDLPENRANLVFEITEGEKAGVLRIQFIGNKAYSHSALRDVVTTSETSILSFLKPTDIYDPDRLAMDRELLRRFYLRKGYADVTISARADFDPQKNGFSIAFRLEEGPHYRFGKIDVESDVSAVSVQDLRSLLRTKPGAAFNAELIEKTLEDLTVELSKKGFAFARARSRNLRDPQGRTVSVSYVVEEGPRIYVERINVRGNTRTHDQVIRREFDIAEGDPYSQVLINRADRRLKALGFFRSVAISSEPGSTPDRVVVNVDVREAPTGFLSYGVGFSPGSR